MKQDMVSMVITLVTDDDHSQVHLLQSLTGIQVVYREPGVMVFNLAPGILLQHCGPGAQAPAYLPRNLPINGFRVHHLPAVIQMAKTNGATVLNLTTDDCTGFTFCYLQLPGGLIIALFG